MEIVLILLLPIIHLIVGTVFSCYLLYRNVDGPATVLFIIVFIASSVLFNEAIEKVGRR